MSRDVTSQRGFPLEVRLAGGCFCSLEILSRSFSFITSFGFSEVRSRIPSAISHLDLCNFWVGGGAGGKFARFVRTDGRCLCLL